MIGAPQKQAQNDGFNEYLVLMNSNRQGLLLFIGKLYLLTYGQ